MKLPTPDEPAEEELQKYVEPDGIEKNLERALTLYFWNNWKSSIDSNFNKDDFIRMYENMSNSEVINNWHTKSGGWNSVVRLYLNIVARRTLK